MSNLDSPSHTLLGWLNRGGSRSGSDRPWLAPPSDAFAAELCTVFGHGSSWNATAGELLSLCHGQSSKILPWEVLRRAEHIALHAPLTVPAPDGRNEYDRRRLITPGGRRGASPGAGCRHLLPWAVIQGQWSVTRYAVELRDMAFFYY